MQKALTMAHPSSPAAEPSRLAISTAWLIPVFVVPSATWRVGHVVAGPGGWGAVADGNWYLLLVSALSLGLSALSIGLLSVWGTVAPTWVPRIGGTALNPRWVFRAAFAGGLGPCLLTAYVIYVRIATPSYRFTPTIGHGGPATVSQMPGMDIMRWYLPLIFWGPLLIVLAIDYRRRSNSAVTTAMLMGEPAR